MKYKTRVLVKMETGGNGSSNVMSHPKLRDVSTIKNESFFEKKITFKLY